MNDIFYNIVKLFQWICTQTGLTYQELNIAVYCFLIPLSWIIVGIFRRQKYFLMLIINLLLLALFLFYRQKFAAISNTFYNQNIKFLEILGGQTLQGYIIVSLIIGLLVPLVMYIALFAIRKRYFNYLVISYFLGLTSYFVLVFLTLKSV